MTDTNLINKFTKHNIFFTGRSEDVENGKHWYRCSTCGKEDWISSFGTFAQLKFYHDPCKKPESTNDVDSRRNEQT